MKLHTIKRMLWLCAQMLILTLTVQIFLYPFTYELWHIMPLGLL